MLEADDLDKGMALAGSNHGEKRVERARLGLSEKGGMEWGGRRRRQLVVAAMGWREYACKKIGWERRERGIGAGDWRSPIMNV